MPCSRPAGAGVILMQDIQCAWGIRAINLFVHESAPY